MPTLVISPYSVATFPEGGGHFWVYLQYVLGMRQLGYDVYWLEAFRTCSEAFSTLRFDPVVTKRTGQYQGQQRCDKKDPSLGPIVARETT